MGMFSRSLRNLGRKDLLVVSGVAEMARPRLEVYQSLSLRPDAGTGHRVDNPHSGGVW